EAYDDVGHGIDWGRRRMRRWPRSKYEKVIHRVIAHEPIRIGQKRYRADRMNGWYEIEFREVGTKRRRTFNLDELVRLAAARKPFAAAPRKRKDGKKRRAQGQGQRQIGFSADDVRFLAPKAHYLANALRTTRSTYKPINS